MTTQASPQQSDGDAKSGVRVPAKFAERVAQIIGDPEARDYITGEYFGYLVENTFRLHSTLFSRARWLLALLVLFLLIDDGAITGVDLAIIELANLHPIHKLLPVLIAYVYADIVAVFILYFTADYLLDELVRLKAPAVVELSLDYLVEPPSRITVADYATQALADTKAGSLAPFLNLLMVIIFFLVPPMFCVYAYVALFDEYGLRNFLVWLSLVGTSALLLDGLYLLGLGMLRDELTP